MIEILQNKILNWSLSKADEFHSHLIRDPREGKYIWEHTDKGIYLTRNGSCHFIGFDGIIHKLTDQYREHDFIMHQRLLKMCSQFNIRLDIPLEHRFIEVGPHDNIVVPKLLYSVVKRPNSELGRDYFADVLEDRVNTDYLIEYVEETGRIISIIKDLVKYSNGLAPACRFTVFHRNTDSVGHFWFDIKKWFMPYNEFLDYHYKDLNILTDYLLLHNKIIDKTKIINVAENIWGQYY